MKIVNIKACARKWSERQHEPILNNRTNKQTDWMNERTNEATWWIKYIHSNLKLAKWNAALSAVLCWRCVLRFTYTICEYVAWCEFSHTVITRKIFLNLAPVFLLCPLFGYNFFSLFIPSSTSSSFGPFFFLFSISKATRIWQKQSSGARKNECVSEWEKKNEEKNWSQPMTVVFFMQSSEYIKSKHFSNILHFFLLPSSPFSLSSLMLSLLPLFSFFFFFFFTLLLAMWQRKSWHNLQNF